MQQLLDGERVGPGAGDHDGAEALHVGVGQAERLGDQFGDGRVGQRPQFDRDDHRCGPADRPVNQRAQRMAGTDLLGRVGDDQRERRLVGAEQVTEGVDAVPVGPLDVVDDEHHTTDVRGERGDEALHGQLQPVADMIGVAHSAVEHGWARAEDGAPPWGQVDQQIGAHPDGRGDLVEHGA